MCGEFNFGPEPEKYICQIEVASRISSSEFSLLKDSGLRSVYREMLTGSGLLLLL
jgi:hypothetical protein